MARKIILAAGHGGKDPGACAFGKTERDEAIKIVNEAARFLKSAGIPNMIVPHAYDLPETIKWINSHSDGDDIAVEVHKNAAGVAATGVEVFHISNASRAKEAKTLSTYLSKETKLLDRGAKPDTKTRFGRLGFIRQTKTVSFLIEAGFITSPKDNKVSNQTYGKGIAKGLAKLIGKDLKPVKIKPQVKHPPKLANHTMPLRKYGDGMKLKNGDKYVALIQKRLRKHGFRVETDGRFGDDTKSAVKRFQQMKKLRFDGVVGDHTWEKLLKN